MKSKFSLVGLVSTAAIAGLALTTTAAIACNSGNKSGGLTETTTTSNPSGLLSNQPSDVNKMGGLTETTTTSNPSGLLSNQPSNINKMGMIGAGAAAIAGLVVGGMALKAKFSKPSTVGESEASELVPSAQEFFQNTNYPIPVPPDALAASADAEANEEITAR